MHRSFVLFTLLPLPALAHVETGAASIVPLAAFLHPFTGPDHLAVMFALGIYAAWQDDRWRWLLPAAFLVAMGVGALAAIVTFSGFPVEAGIAASLCLVGLGLALRCRVWPAAALMVVVVSALCHGYAHGRELLQAGSVLPRMCAFLAATALLQGLGLLLGGYARQPAAMVLLRVAGAAAAVAGACLLAAG
jgi:urease accessory protein